MPVARPFDQRIQLAPQRFVRQYGIEVSGPEPALAGITGHELLVKTVADIADPIGPGLPVDPGDDIDLALFLVQPKYKSPSTDATMAPAL